MPDGKCERLYHTPTLLCDYTFYGILDIFEYVLISKTNKILNTDGKDKIPPSLLLYKIHIPLPSSLYSLMGGIT